MFAHRCAILASAILCLLTQSTLAQKVNQPWTAPRGAHESRIITCTQPVPPAGGLAAMDDWICPASGAMTRIQWWGVVSTPAQLQRRWYIAFYNSLATACLPANRVYQACVIPVSKPVGTDCDGRIVYLFMATLPPPYFVQTAGQHYWVEVAEDDSTSVTPGVPDFKWSSHIPISPSPMCPAVQQPAGGGAFIQPIPDDCPNPIQTDLAFRIFGGVIGGTVPLTHIPQVMHISLYNPAGQAVETFDVPVFPDGTFAFEPDSPSGHYRVGIHVDSFFDVFVELDFNQDGDNMIQMPPLCKTPDFNQDGDVGTDDDIADFFRTLGGLCE
jgi:hypothetical protein